MEITLVICATVLALAVLAGLVLLGVTALQHRPVAPVTPAQTVQETVEKLVGAGSDVLKATVTPSYVSIIRQDKEVHETTREAISRGVGGRFASTICTSLRLDPPRSDQSQPTTGEGGVHIDLSGWQVGSGTPTPAPVPTPTNAAVTVTAAETERAGPNGGPNQPS